ncbi:hypothetical protein [Ornithinimicrobium avium]|uniref:hypothetical protein n=1 Tax=Ornithinimicrobium avium TaxID=2283195 RepID=UPI0013B3FA74|nr:hypothetical protein [Ornithinimicrobium avium]
MQISRTGDTQVTGNLFEQHVVRRGTTVTGRLATTPEAAEVLHTLIASCEGKIVLGGSRSTQGAATLVVSDAPTPTLERVGGTTDQVIVRLAAPGVFVDRLGRPAAAPYGAELRQQLGSPVTVTRAWSDRWTVEGGWHAASGLPKPQERCVAAGASYVLASQNPVTDDALTRLAMRGVGLRRYEGFGALAVTERAESWS